MKNKNTKKGRPQLLKKGVRAGFLIEKDIWEEYKEIQALTGNSSSQSIRNFILKDLKRLKYEIQL